MKKKEEIYYNDIQLDSKEELDFCYWCEEAKEHGFLQQWEIHKTPYLLTPKKTMKIEKRLKTKVKIVEKHLLYEHVVKADFAILTTELFETTFPKHGLISTGLDNIYVIDTKGSFEMHDGSRSFSINQKVLYHIHGVFMNKVIASGNNAKNWFIKTWVPMKTRLTDSTRQVQRCYQGKKTIHDII